MPFALSQRHFTMDPAIPASSLLSVSQLSYFSASSRGEATAKLLGFCVNVCRASE
jgi:hypothetical protein